MKKPHTTIKRMINGCSPVMFAPFGLFILAVVAAIFGEWEMTLCLATFAAVILALTFALAYITALSDEEDEAFEAMFRHISKKDEESTDKQ